MAEPPIPQAPTRDERLAAKARWHRQRTIREEAQQRRFRLEAKKMRAYFFLAAPLGATRRRVARWLAYALVAGPWEAEPARARLSEALGVQWYFVEPLVKTVLARFSKAPTTDAELERLVLAVVRLKGYRRAWRLKRRPQIVRYYGAPLRVHASVTWLTRTLPSLPSQMDLARWLGLTPDELLWFADIRGWESKVEGTPLSHYLYTWIPKRGGMHRLIEAPRPRLKAMQRNPQVCVAVHQNYHGWHSARGAQFFGTAHIIEPHASGWDHGMKVFRWHEWMSDLGMDTSKPFDRQVLKVVPDSILYIETWLWKQGYAAKQRWRRND